MKKQPPQLAPDSSQTGTRSDSIPCLNDCEWKIQVVGKVWSYWTIAPWHPRQLEPENMFFDQRENPKKVPAFHGAERQSVAGMISRAKASRNPVSVWHVSKQS